MRAENEFPDVAHPIGVEVGDLRGKPIGSKNTDEKRDRAGGTPKEFRQAFAHKGKLIAIKPMAPLPATETEEPVPADETDIRGLSTINSSVIRAVCRSHG